MVVVATENYNWPFTLNLSPDSVREIPSVHRTAMLKYHVIKLISSRFNLATSSQIALVGGGGRWLS